MGGLEKRKKRRRKTKINQQVSLRAGHENIQENEETAGVGESKKSVKW